MWTDEWQGHVAFLKDSASVICKLRVNLPSYGTYERRYIARLRGAAPDVIQEAKEAP